MAPELRFELTAGSASAEEFKACCAAVYESDAVRYLLGDSWHPGGLRLTEEIGRRMRLDRGDRVLDVACGYGESARALARRFGCAVVGSDLSPGIVEAAAQATKSEGFGALVSFQTADAEVLPFPAGSFDAVLCECAFCTFPNKERAAAEMARVLKTGGRLALADVTLIPGPLPPDLESLLARVLCVADALPLTGYARLLQEASLQVLEQQDCSWAARSFLKGIDQKLLIARVAQAVGKLSLNGLDIRQARRILNGVRSLVDEGRLSYGYIIAGKE
ncbi:MAG TPA: methyltransferase domain-containing protein [Dehalococcoidia bacterium]|nr:methyltransferase domain-containing protein [Dehalococcoidia bacterium]